jgi:hypothetical protein
VGLSRDPIWETVAEPVAYVRAVLAREAPDIPDGLIEAAPWQQVEVAISTLDVDEEMVAAHDADTAHLGRRDRVLGRIEAGETLPPLIALGSARRLVDGYARLRALRLLVVERAAVLVQT